jgi:hypothetical protein
MLQDTLLKFVEQFMLAGGIGIGGLVVRQLQRIGDRLEKLTVELAVIVTKVQEHDRRIESLEDDDRLDA